MAMEHLQMSVYAVVAVAGFQFYGSGVQFVVAALKFVVVGAFVSVVAAGSHCCG